MIDIGGAAFSVPCYRNGSAWHSVGLPRFHAMRSWPSVGGGSQDVLGRLRFIQCQMSSITKAVAKVFFQKCAVFAFRMRELGLEPECVSCNFSI